MTAFIDRDNINRLIGGAGIEGDIGILSIDLDGNDLWILEAIDVVSPRILILEYNATFGPEAAVTVPYDPSFVRGEKHSSNLYWGASLAALTRTANAKGFSLVGSQPRGQQRVLRARRRGRRRCPCSRPPTRGARAASASRAARPAS